jgi:hypothetical protein
VQSFPSVGPDDWGKIVLADHCTLRLGTGAIGDIVKITVTGIKVTVDVENIGVDTAAALKAGKFDKIVPKITRSAAQGFVLDSARVTGLSVSPSIKQTRDSVPAIEASKNDSLEVLRGKFAAQARRIAEMEGERETFRATEQRLNHAQQRAIVRAHFDEMIQAVEDAVRTGKLLPATRLMIKRNFLQDERSAMNFTRKQLNGIMRQADASKLRCRAIRRRAAAPMSISNRPSTAWWSGNARSWRARASPGTKRWSWRSRRIRRRSRKSSIAI